MNSTSTNTPPITLIRDVLRNSFINVSPALKPKSNTEPLIMKFNRLDGAYSHIEDKYGNVFHLSHNAPVIILDNIKKWEDIK